MPGNPEVEGREPRSATTARGWAWLPGFLSLALAMAFSTLVEQSKLLDRFEDAVVREVARKREVNRVISPPGLNELEIQQLEISAQVRVAALEQRTGVEGVIARLGGVAPMQRGALAQLIQDLAKRLPDAS